MVHSILTRKLDFITLWLTTSLEQPEVPLLTQFSIINTEWKFYIPSRSLLSTLIILQELQGKQNQVLKNRSNRNILETKQIFPNSKVWCKGERERKKMAKKVVGEFVREQRQRQTRPKGASDRYTFNIHPSTFTAGANPSNHRAKADYALDQSTVPHRADIEKE